MAFLESLGGGEILIISVVVLLLFGPKRLPEIARMLGRTSAQFHNAFQDFKDQLLRGEPEQPPPPGPNAEPPGLPEEYDAEPNRGTKPPDRSGAPDESGPPDAPRAG
jgi:sec-independent protein translocase protein TatA